MAGFPPPPRDRRVALALIASVFGLTTYTAVAQQRDQAAFEPVPEHAVTTDFHTAMENVATGWSTQDVALALSAFTDDVLYTEPPDLQIYRGRRQLEAFFNHVAPGSTMIWHNLWFDAETGIGAGEYSFRNGWRDTAVHGVAVVIMENGKIRIWREYQRRGDIDFEAFHNPDDKDWQTTGADYE